PRIQAIPIDQKKPELSTLRTVFTLLKEKEKVVIFPEGERSWDGEITETGQPGVGMIVTKSRAPVLAMRIFGAEKALPRGAKGLKPHPVTVAVGELLTFDDLIDDPELSTKQTYQAVADRIMKGIREIELRDSRGE
ncbi:MAG: lysophospholipid acyltransferase family protein, partial [Verrucomicrobiota bacterium]